MAGLVCSSEASDRLEEEGQKLGHTLSGFAGARSNHATSPLALDDLARVLSPEHRDCRELVAFALLTDVASESGWRKGSAPLLHPDSFANRYRGVLALCAELVLLRLLPLLERGGAHWAAGGVRLYAEMKASASAKTTWRTHFGLEKAGASDDRYVTFDCGDFYPIVAQILSEFPNVRRPLLDPDILKAVDLVPYCQKAGEHQGRAHHCRFHTGNTLTSPPESSCLPLGAHFLAQSLALHLAGPGPGGTNLVELLEAGFALRSEEAAATLLDLGRAVDVTGAPREEIIDTWVDRLEDWKTLQPDWTNAACAVVRWGSNQVSRAARKFTRGNLGRLVARVEDRSAKP